MKETTLAVLVYVCFFSLIAFALVLTKNANCLFALMLTPTINATNEDNNEQEED